MHRKNDISKAIKIGVGLTYILMILVNVMATLLPINNQTTAEVSDAYKNLFAPAGFTFSIWGIIYLLLFFFVLYFTGVISRDKSKIHLENYNRIGILFIIYALANSLWLFVWHYEKFNISLGLMLVMLVALIIINNLGLDSRLSKKEKLFLKIPFSVNLGWISVATIANVTVYLLSINWDSLGLSESLWTVLVIITAMIIGVLYTVINNDLTFGLVVIWAFIGIFVKHLLPSGFNSQYPQIMVVVLVSIIAVIISQVYVIIRRKKDLY